MPILHTSFSNFKHLFQYLYYVKCIVKLYVEKIQYVLFYQAMVIIFKVLKKKTCFSQVIATGQDSIYKSSQFSMA